MPRISMSKEVQLLASGSPYTTNYLWFTKDNSRAATVPVNGSFVRPGIYVSYLSVQHVTPKWKFTDSFDRVSLSISGMKANQYSDEYTSHRSAENLINRALRSVADAKMTLGESLAESRSTFKMIRNNSVSVYNMFRYLRRGNMQAAARSVGLNRRDFRNVGNDASGKYLELIFGWRPLVNEIYNGVQVINNGVNNDPDTGFIVGYAKDKFSLTRPSLYEGSYGLKTTFHSEFGAHAKVNFAFNHNDYGRSLNQLGISNPVQVVWNVLPHTYLLDWFLPIGAYLGGFTAANGLSFLNGYYTRKATHTFSAEVQKPIVNQYRLVTGAHSQYIVVRRDLITSASPRLPGLQVPNMLSQAITATALFTQFATRRR